MLPLYIKSGYRPFCSYWWKHWLNFPNHFRRVKWIYQRATRGFADCDVWSYDSFLCKTIPPALKRLKETTHGYPHGLTPEKWDEILDKIILGFETAKAFIDGPPDEFYTDKDPFVYMEELEENRKKSIGKNGSYYTSKQDFNREKYLEWKEKQDKIFEEGMDLFKKYFYNLWD